MADVSKSEYRGLLIPDPRIKNANLDLTNSTFTQAGPQPGVAVDTSSTVSDLVIDSGGSMAASDELRIRTQAGGYPSKSYDSAGFVWYDENSIAQLVIQDIRYDAVTAGPDGENVTIAYTTGATAGAEVVTVTSNAISIQIETGVSTSAHIKTAFDLVAAAVALASCNDIGPTPAPVQTGAVAAAALANQWRGYNTPDAINGWEWLEFETSPINYFEPEVLTLDNDTVICASQADNNSSDVHHIAIKTFDPDTSVWTSQTSIANDQSTAVQISLSPAMLQLPSGRVLLYHWGEDQNSRQNIMMYYSDDFGVTFTLGSSAVLSSNIDTSTITNTQRIRVAYNKGQICMLAAVTVSGIQLIQWASSDDGNTFTVIDVSAATTIVADDQFDMVALDTSGFLVAYIDSSNYIRSKSLANAFDVFDEAASVVVNSASTYDSSITAYKMSNNRINIIARRIGVAHEALQTFGSDDNGATWPTSTAGTYLDMHTIEFDQSTTVYTTQIAATMCRGTCVMAFKFNDDVGTTDLYSLGVAYIGGSSTAVLPAQAINRDIPSQSMGWELSYLGLTLPDTLQWIQTGAGTQNLVDYGFECTTAAATETYTSRSLGTTVTDGLLVLFSVKVDSNDTAASGVHISPKLDEGSGLDLWGIRCSLETTGFTMVDISSSTELADILIDTTAGLEVLMAMNVPDGSSNGTFTYWYRANGSAIDREWKQGQTALTMQRGAAAGTTNNRIEFGHVASTAVSVWKQVLVSRLSFTDATVDMGQTNPDDLIARAFAITPTPVNGTSIKASSGPTFLGETWSIDTRYDFGIENLDTEIQPSPQIGWRGTGETAEEIIWLLNDQNTLTRYGQATIGIAFLNSNIIGYTLSGLNVDGTWTQITSPTVGNNNVVSTMYGNAFYMADASGNGTYYDYNELEGAYLQIDYGKNDTIYPRTISGNTEGHVSNSTTKIATVFFDGLDGNEPAPGNTLRIVPLQSITIMPAVADYVGFKVIIDENSGGTVNGYHEIGNIIIGPIEYFGAQYSHGREITVENNTELITRRDGTRYSKNLGKPRRKVSFSWDQGVDTSSVNGGTSFVSDYSLPYTGASEPVASPAGTPAQVQGILEYTKGANKPVIYIPYIEATSSIIVHNSRRDMIYGRIVSTSTISTVLGDENSDEVMRISTIEIEEEI